MATAVYSITEPQTLSALESRLRKCWRSIFRPLCKILSVRCLTGVHDAEIRMGPMDPMGIPWQWEV